MKSQPQGATCFAPHSQPGKEGRRKGGRKEEGGRGRGGERPSILIPASSLLLTILGKGAMIFPSVETCQGPSHIAGPEDDNTILAISVLPLPPLQRGGAAFISLPSLHPTVKQYCLDQKTMVVFSQWEDSWQWKILIRKILEDEKDAMGGIVKCLWVNAPVGPILPRAWCRKHSWCYGSVRYGIVYHATRILQWTRAEFVGHFLALDATQCLRQPPCTLEKWRLFCLWGACRRSVSWYPRLLTDHSTEKDISFSSKCPTQWLPSHFKCHWMRYKIVFPIPSPKTVKPLKGSRGTQWQLVAFAKLLSVDLILRLLCLFSIKLINNTKGHISLSLQKDGPQYVLLWPTVPGNFHTFNTHKYTTPSIYFEQKEKKKVK